VEQATEADDDASLFHGVSVHSARSIAAVRRHTCMMKTMIGFLGSYVDGLTPSRMPPCAAAREGMMRMLPRRVERRKGEKRSKAAQRNARRRQAITKRIGRDCRRGGNKDALYGVEGSAPVAFEGGWGDVECQMAVKEEVWAYEGSGQ